MSSPQPGPRIPRARFFGARAASWTSAVLAGLASLVGGCSSTASSSELETPAADRELVSPALDAKMAAVAAAIEQRGFAAVEEPARAFLVEQDALVEPASLPTGRCQVFVALGSQALREISLGVFDSSGAEMAAARAEGSSVALRYCPDLPGTHYVAVRALAGDGLVTARRFEGPSGIAIEIDDLFGPRDEGTEAP